MIWLASFPRSGNTFVRNIFFDVFGIDSATFDLNNGVLLENDYASFPVVKTHMLPGELIPDDPSVKAVYLLRDGRDAMVSIAHHRSDIIAPGSDYTENLRAAIYAEKGSYFGGWSENVRQWMDRADLIIRYEELIADPAGCTEKIRQLTGWVKGDYSKIQDFEALKFGIPKYGAGRDHAMNESEKRALAEKNFRKGKAGGWKEEMPDELHDLFWSIHGDVMLQMGYAYDGTFNPVPNIDFDWKLTSKCTPFHATVSVLETQKIKVLIEASKVVDPVNDGVKRYQMTLLKELLEVHLNPAGRWHFDLFVHGSRQPITAFASAILGRFRDGHGDDHALDKNLRLPPTVRFQQMLLRLIPMEFKTMLVRKNILIFHRAFDLWWALLHRIFHLVALGRRQLVRGMANLVFLLTGRDFRYRPEETEGYDLIHLPLQHHYAPFVGTTIPLITTIHDFTHALFPGFHTPQNIRNAERGWKFARNNSAALIAVSGSTLNDIKKLTETSETPVKVIHEAIARSSFNHRINSETRRQVCAKYNIPDSPFLFTLSSIEPRKNLENIIRGFFEMVSKDVNMNLNLVVAGKKCWGTFHPHTLIGFDPQRVIFTGFVDDHDLPELFSESIAFCYISHYEGFGLPILEALNCGTPVIYGNNSSMPEVVGDAGLGADASDFKDIGKQMSTLFYDEKLREVLKRKALKQAAGFSTRLMAARTLELYLNTISEHVKNNR